ncbi:hypothetical protein Ciccas_010431 [Cichlidogyrus casuarinus]|uniref:Uncharacterized protein n=1 Tax=Cichlidogyrus casuarinus TaxID=1844966 RepID=A0ABD2PU48_9PLAT
MSRSEEEKRQRRDEALALLQERSSKLSLGKILPQSLLDKRVEAVFNCFQNAKLNKQLAYQLLDIVLVRQFPDVFTGQPFVPDRIRVVEEVLMKQAHRNASSTQLSDDTSRNKTQTNPKNKLPQLPLF